MTCTVESVSYTEIVCETDCLTTPDDCPVGDLSPKVHVAVVGGVLVAECTGDGPCVLTTSDSANVTDITPVKQSQGILSIFFQ